MLTQNDFTGWLNIDSDGTMEWFSEKEYADSRATGLRIACRKVHFSMGIVMDATVNNFSATSYELAL